MVAPARPRPPAAIWLSLATLPTIVDEGPILRKELPATLSDKDRGWLPYFAFPESTPAHDMHLYFTFTMCLSSGQEVFGYVLFNQTLDSKVRRGAVQESTVILSAVPYAGTFYSVLAALASCPAEEQDPMGEAILATASQWPPPTAALDLELPLMGTMLKCGPMPVDAFSAWMQRTYYGTPGLQPRWSVTPEGSGLLYPPALDPTSAYASVPEPQGTRKGSIPTLWWDVRESDGAMAIRQAASGDEPFVSHEAGPVPYWDAALAPSPGAGVPNQGNIQRAYSHPLLQPSPTASPRSSRTARPPSHNQRSSGSAPQSGPNSPLNPSSPPAWSQSPQGDRPLGLPPPSPPSATTAGSALAHEAPVPAAIHLQHPSLSSQTIVLSPVPTKPAHGLGAGLQPPPLALDLSSEPAQQPPLPAPSSPTEMAPPLPAGILPAASSHSALSLSASTCSSRTNSPESESGPHPADPTLAACMVSVLKDACEASSPDDYISGVPRTDTLPVTDRARTPSLPAQATPNVPGTPASQ
eukprot:gene9869-1778_t